MDTYCYATNFQEATDMQNDNSGVREFVLRVAATVSGGIILILLVAIILFFFPWFAGYMP